MLGLGGGGSKPWGCRVGRAGRGDPNRQVKDGGRGEFWVTEGGRIGSY